MKKKSEIEKNKVEINFCFISSETECDTTYKYIAFVLDLNGKQKKNCQYDEVTLIFLIISQIGPK